MQHADYSTRHGARLDAANQSWHLSTPTPYDPPITYGGWSQSRSLGLRIAGILHAREQTFHDAQDTSSNQHGSNDSSERPKKRRRLKYRVILHTSPFLRCLQTSVGIAAGLAQFDPSTGTGSKQQRSTSHSPTLRVPESHSTSVSAAKQDLTHALAYKALHEHKRHRKCKLRVDAFLGEWLNPSYFEGITAPPPSAMMVATAKGELMESEAVEIFYPAGTSRTANSDLWGGANGTSRSSRGSALDDLSPLEEALPTRSPNRSRANTIESGRKSPFRPGSPLLQPLTSTLPKQESAVYHPPTPHYAVSPAQPIPRGYVAHARNECVDVDWQWDSSKQPDPWGDGGEYGEEWSAMHKRSRKGMNRLARWYSEQSSEPDPHFRLFSAEDDEEVQEETVVVLVTHGAGCNALIGALTGQPVLLDVGMASLTMAVRKDETAVASPLMQRRNSTGTNLSSLYDMKFVSSTEHLRPGADPRQTSTSPTSGALDTRSLHHALSKHAASLDTAPSRSNTSSLLGSIRRPSVINTNSSDAIDKRKTGAQQSKPAPTSASSAVTPGLWTPPAARTPVMRPQQTGHALADIRAGNLASIPADPLSPPAVGTSTLTKSPVITTASEFKPQTGETHDKKGSDPPTHFPPSGDQAPQYLKREGLWEGQISGAQVSRLVREPKRRWTVRQD